MTHGERIIEKFVEQENQLIAKGFPRAAPWWREKLVRFYLSGKRTHVLRVGRRGGKSSTICRVAVVEALYGLHHIQPGDIGTVAILSAERGQAADRLRTIEAILKAAVQYRALCSYSPAWHLIAFFPMWHRPPLFPKSRVACSHLLTARISANEYSPSTD